MDHRSRRCKNLLVALLLSVVPGCTIFPEVPNHPTKSYVITLDASQVAEWPACGAPDGVLVVSALREPAGLASSGIAYLTRPHEVKYYAYNQWAGNPARMVLPLLVQAMEKTNCWSTVAYAESGLRGHHRLETEILKWQQEFFPTPSQLHLSFRVQLIDTQSREVIAGRRFELTEAAPTDDAYGAVRASNRAVNRWLRELAHWVTSSAAGKLRVAPASSARP